MARKPTVTTASLNRICRQVATGKSLRKALKGKGMPSMSRFFELVDQQPAWAEQYARARQRGIEHHIDGIIDLADSATTDNAHAVRLRVDTRKWIASKILPRVYGDKQQIELSTTSEDWGERLRRAKERLANERMRVVAEQPAQLAQLEPLPTLPQVSSDAEYDSLPSGALFVDPEGAERQKP